MSEIMIKIENLHKVFGSDLHVLQGINLEVKKGEVIVILGPSGSGKSTLLRCINFLEEPTAGTIEVNGVRINAGEEGKVRKSKILDIRKAAGMCFQSFNLFPHMTVIDNVIEGPVTVLGQSKKEAIPYAEELLEWVGLGDKRNEYPARLSGGQQQRVAIARSLVNDPEIILADEPTGNLDSKAGKQVMHMLARLHKEEGKTIILVTHDVDLVKYSEKTIYLKDGEVVKIKTNHRATEG